LKTKSFLISGGWETQQGVNCVDKGFKENQ